MASRRGAVKVNPVTGELKRVDGNKQAGTMRSGCVTLPEKYMHAARDAGLAEGTGELFLFLSLVCAYRASVRPSGAEDAWGDTNLATVTDVAQVRLTAFWMRSPGCVGNDMAVCNDLNYSCCVLACAAMFSHIKSLTKMGVGEVHSGSSMATTGAPATSSAGTATAATKTYKSALPSRAERSRIVAGKVTGPAAAAKPALGSGGPRIKQVVQGRSRTVKSGPAKTTGKSADSFERRKGVVNTLGGAKDTTRTKKDESTGVRRGAGNISGFAGPVEARAPTKSLRSKPSASTAAPAAKSAPARRGGIGGTAGGGAGSKAKTGGASRKAGGASGAGASASSADVRAARAAFLTRFE